MTIIQECFIINDDKERKRWAILKLEHTEYPNCKF